MCGGLGPLAYLPPPGSLPSFPLCTGIGPRELPCPSAGHPAPACWFTPLPSELPEGGGPSFRFLRATWGRCLGLGGCRLEWVRGALALACPLSLCPLERLKGSGVGDAGAGSLEPRARRPASRWVACCAFVCFSIGCTFRTVLDTQKIAQISQRFPHTHPGGRFSCC